MTCFMDTTPGHMAEVHFIDPGGDPDILVIKVGSEGVFGEVLPAGFEIKSHLPDHLHTEIPLLLFGIELMQKGIIDLLLAPDMVQQVLQRRAYLAEYLIQARYRTTFFNLISQAIITILFISAHFPSLS